MFHSAQNNTIESIDNLGEYIYSVAYLQKTKKWSLWYLAGLNNILLRQKSLVQTWAQGAVWNAIIYQRIVTEHF